MNEHERERSEEPEPSWIRGLRALCIWVPCSQEASQVALVRKNPPATQDTQESWVWSLGREDSPGGGNGHPLQYSCLENPRGRGAWRATGRGVTASRAQLSGYEHLGLEPHHYWRWLQAQVQRAEGAFPRLTAVTIPRSLWSSFGNFYW